LPGETPPAPRAWQLDYELEAGWRFVRLVPQVEHPIPLPEQTRAVGAWIFGDASDFTLRTRVVDTTGQTFQTTGPRVDWTGWRWVEIPLEDLEGVEHWGGAQDGVPHWPLHVDCPLLLDGPRTKVAGTLYVALLTLIVRPE
jgi:hypothetical protein